MGWFDTPLLWLALLVLGCRLLLSRRPPGWRVFFPLLNLGAVYACFFRAGNESYYALFAALFIGYLVVVSGQHLTLRWFVRGQGECAWIAFIAPLLFLAVVRYVPVLEWLGMLHPQVGAVLGRHPEFTLGAFFVGLSYLAFRTSHLVMEVRNQVVPMPGWLDYLGYAFFFPTFAVGPINPYSQHVRALAESGPPVIPVGRALLRILIGGVKYKFLGPLANTLSYSGLMLDGHPHSWVDLPVSMVAYYLYLYCNFSGFCDMAVGAAGLMGVPVNENFDRPLGARNVKDFWNRWHITLSTYMRDVVFSPLSKWLVRLMGPANANHAIAVTIIVVFLLVGIWHGVGWHFAAFGLMHAVGVVGNHYWTIGLKKWLGRERFLAYQRSRLIHASAVVMTFLYVAASMMLFANDFRQIQTMMEMIR